MSAVVTPRRTRITGSDSSGRSHSGKSARLAHDRLEDFVNRDIDDVLDLFAEFNSATHGATGTFSLAQLSALKTRVEGAIQFLALVVRPV